MLAATAFGTAALLCLQLGAAQRLDRLVALAHLDAAVRYFHPPVATNAARWDSLFAANVVAIADAPDGAEYGRRIASMMAALGDTTSGGPQGTLIYNGFPPTTSTGYQFYTWCGGARPGR